MCRSLRSYLHSAHVESKAVVAFVLRGRQREPKSSLGMHPENGMMPGLPGAEVVEVPLVIQLSIVADQVCSQLRKGLKVSAVNTLEFMQFGDLHVCLHAYFSGSRSMTQRAKCSCTIWVASSWKELFRTD